MKQKSPVQQEEFKAAEILTKKESPKLQETKESIIAYTAQDNWAKFDYSSRYLDALASIFHTQSAVTATIEEQNIVYLSYSNDTSMVPQARRSFNFIKKNIQKENSSADNLLGIYLSYNLDFYALTKLAQKFTTSLDCRSKLSKLLESINTVSGAGDKTLIKLDKNLKGEYEVESNQLENLYKNSTTTVTLYKSILADHYNDIQKEHLEKFLRPLQDTYKLYYYLNNLGNKEKIKDIIILPNPHAIHADTNIVANFPDSDLIDKNKNYIGVSKLCCGYCHTYLDKNNYNHRGTHGVCDDKWGFPWLDKETKSPLEEKFKNSVKSIGEFNIENPPPQHRKLSMDAFEKDIKLSDSNLYQYKQDLGLTEQKKLSTPHQQKPNRNCDCKVFSVSGIKYDNPILNHPKQLKILENNLSMNFLEVIDRVNAFDREFVEELCLVGNMELLQECFI